MRLIRHWEATYVYRAGQDEDQVPILTSPIFGATSRPATGIASTESEECQADPIFGTEARMTPSTPG